MGIMIVAKFHSAPELALPADEVSISCSIEPFSPSVANFDVERVKNSHFFIASASLVSPNTSQNLHEFSQNAYAHLVDDT